MAARIKGAELRFYEGGHLFMLQDRAALPAMISFLKGGVSRTDPFPVQSPKLSLISPA